MKKMKLFVSLLLTLCICVTAVAFAADYSDRYGDNTLKRSSTVKRVVKNVQADLSLNTSYNLEHDGIYGSNTSKAAKEFQEDNNLSVDGQVGKNTKTVLYPVRDTRYDY